jgi:hypothetical protein
LYDEGVQHIDVLWITPEVFVSGFQFVVKPEGASGDERQISDYNLWFGGIDVSGMEEFTRISHIRLPSYQRWNVHSISSFDKVRSEPLVPSLAPIHYLRVVPGIPCRLLQANCPRMGQSHHVSMLALRGISIYFSTRLHFCFSTAES